MSNVIAHDRLKINQKIIINVKKGANFIVQDRLKINQKRMLCQKEAIKI